jgi:phosphotransacetylase
MAERGQITGGLVDGPLAFDDAINPEAAKRNGIVSIVAGQSDILVAPDLESANMLMRQLIVLGGAEAAGIVVGARVPIVLLRRADGVETGVASFALAVLAARADGPH